MYPYMLYNISSGFWVSILLTNTVIFPPLNVCTITLSMTNSDYTQLCQKGQILLSSEILCQIYGKHFYFLGFLEFRIKDKGV